MWYSLCAVGDVVEATEEVEYATNQGMITVSIGDKGWVTAIDENYCQITIMPTLARIPFSSFPDSTFRTIKDVA